MNDTPTTSELGQATEILFEAILFIFQGEDVGLYIGGGILGVGLIVALHARFVSSRRIIKAIEQPLRTLSRLNDRREFADGIDDVDTKFRGNALLERAWFEFHETLILPVEHHGYSEKRYDYVQNTQRPQAYFNLAVVPALRLKPWVSPATFIAIGLLLTFIGLVAALTEAASAFTADNADGAAIEQAINNLLIVAGAKFFASIGGLAASLLVTVVLTRRQGHIQARLAALCDALEKRTWYVSATQVASDQYAYAIRQTARLEELKDSLAVSIGQSLQSTVGALPNELAGALSGRFASVVGAIDEMKDELGQNISQALVENTQPLSDGLRTATEDAIKAALDQLGQSSADLAQTTDRITPVVAGFEAAASSLSGATDRLTGATDTVGPVIEQIKTVQAQGQETQALINNTVTTLQTDMQAARKLVERISEENAAVLTSLRETWDTQANQLKLSDAELEKAFDVILRLTRSSSDHLNEQLKLMDSSAAGIANHLHGAQAELTEAIESLDETVSKLRQAP